MGNSIPRLLLTPGEPAGIGPDITLMIASENLAAEVVVVADPDLLSERAATLGLDIKLNIINGTDAGSFEHRAGQLHVLPVKLAVASTPGNLDSRNSAYVLDCLTQATQHCRSARAGAIVTGPVHKGVINDAGFAFTGHTEFLAALSDSRPVMMLATESLRVALATTHLPLSQVSQAIDFDSLIYIITTLHDFLRNQCAIESPNIIVCGLNPHAGEDGHLGREEIDTITPAIQHCRDKGIRISGPTPADTAFTTHSLEHADAVLAMYHDQGLPVLKHTGFGRAVNITLGLPFIRTSVDHGTALDLAGSGHANADSMQAAINMAMRLRAN